MASLLKWLTKNTFLNKLQVNFLSKDCNQDEELRSDQIKLRRKRLGMRWLAPNGEKG